MSLDTYSNLKTELANWLRRSNITAASDIIDTGIDLFEAYARRDLQAEDMLLETTLTTVSGFSDVTLPAGFRQVDTLRTSTGLVLTQKTRDALARAWGAATGGPVEYALGPTPAGGKHTLRLGPTPDGDYTLYLTYNAKLVGLSSATGETTNWLLAYAPDLYLYGSLYHLLNYIRDDANKALIGPDVAAIVAQVQADQQRLKQSGAGQAQAQALGMTP